jgi:hypothetical protein
MRQSNRIYYAIKHMFKILIDLKCCHLPKIVKIVEVIPIFVDNIVLYQQKTKIRNWVNKHQSLQGACLIYTSKSYKVLFVRTVPTNQVKYGL